MECTVDGKLTGWLRATSCEQPTTTTSATGSRSSQLEARSPETPNNYRPKYFALISVYSFHFSGRSSSAKIADTGHTGTQAPQSMHSTGSIYSMVSVPNFSESFLG